MSKVKTMAAMGALLIGAAYAQNTDQGDYIVNVLETTKVEWTGGNNEISDAKGILVSNATSPMTLEFTVTTNREEWDLSLQTANGGKLLRDDGTPIRTDIVSDGSLGNNGTLYVKLKEITSDDKINNVKIGSGKDISVTAPVSSLASAAFDETKFESAGLVESVFEVKAGLAGTKIIAPPGVYKETVTLTFVGNTN